MADDAVVVLLRIALDDGVGVEREDGEDVSVDGAGWLVEVVDIGAGDEVLPVIDDPVELAGAFIELVADGAVPLYQPRQSQGQAELQASADQTENQTTPAADALA